MSRFEERKNDYFNAVDRLQLSHIYDEEKSRAIYELIKNKYLVQLVKLKGRL